MQFLASAQELIMLTRNMGSCHLVNQTIGLSVPVLLTWTYGCSPGPHQPMVFHIAFHLSTFSWTCWSLNLGPSALLGFRQAYSRGSFCWHLNLYAKPAPALTCPPLRPAKQFGNHLTAILQNNAEFVLNLFPLPVSNSDSLLACKVFI